MLPPSSVKHKLAEKKTISLGAQHRYPAGISVIAITRVTGVQLCVTESLQQGHLCIRDFILLINLPSSLHIYYKYLRILQQ